MKVIKNVLAGLGAMVILVFIAGFVSGLFQKPFTTAEVIEVYEQGHPIDEAWVIFEVREIVDHGIVGQTFWVEDVERAAFINDDVRFDDVEVGDTLEVYVNDIYTMLGSHILEFDGHRVQVTKGGK